MQIVVVSGGCRLVPELYAVPYDKVAAEKRQRGTQDRVAAGATYAFKLSSLRIFTF